MPASSLGDVGADGGGDDHLLGLGRDQRQLLAAAGVELGEDVVEQQHRGLMVRRVGALQLEAAQPQRERHRPALAVAGVAAHRQLTDAQVEVVAVRADQVHAPFELGRAHPDQLGSSAVRKRLDRRHLVGGQFGQHLGEARGVVQAQPGAGRRHLRVRGHRVRTQVADRLEPRRQQLAAVLGQMGVPHVQGRRDRLPLGRSRPDEPRRPPADFSNAARWRSTRS